MKNLIVYSSRLGTAEKCALKLKSYFKNETTIVNLKSGEVPDLLLFDNIVIGGSIRIGKVQKEVIEFCQNNLDSLKKKTIGIFLCMGENEDKFDEYLKSNFSQDFLGIVSVKGFFGGEFNYSKMNFLLRAMIRRMSRDKEEPKLKDENIKKFVEDLEKIHKQTSN